jgi:hypothetical protein
MPDSAACIHDLSRLIKSDLEGVVSRWVDGVARRSWTLQRQGEIQDGEMEPLDLIQKRCRQFLAALDKALEGASDLEVGAPAFRESVQILAFTAGWMAGSGMRITDAVSLVHSLREALGCPEHQPFFESLTVTVTESFCASLEQRAQARYREAMEKSQLVCDLHPQLPVLFLVGDPDRHGVEDAVGRVMMLAAMHEAKAVVVDSSGLIWPETLLVEAHQILAEHGEAARVKVFLSGVTPALNSELPEHSVISVHEHLTGAITTAVASFGLSWALEPSK